MCGHVVCVIYVGTRAQQATYMCGGGLRGLASQQVCVALLLLLLLPQLKSLWAGVGGWGGTDATVLG